MEHSPLMEAEVSSLQERFWSKVSKDADGCWRWTASLLPSGHAQFQLGSSPTVAHRVAYEWLIRPLAAGERLMNKCGTVRCVNPDHWTLKARMASVCSVARCERTAAARGLCRTHYHRWKKYGDPMIVRGHHDDDESRFLAKVRKDAPPPEFNPSLGSCWFWLGATNNGYGFFRMAGRRFASHRWAYQRWVGPIPDDATIDHLCRVTWCVNPDHLEPVSRPENTVRQGKARTHCPNGHEYTPDNTTKINGYRACKACRSAASRMKDDRARAARLKQ